MRRIACNLLNKIFQCSQLFVQLKIDETPKVVLIRETHTLCKTFYRWADVRVSLSKKSLLVNQVLVLFHNIDSLHIFDVKKNCCIIYLYLYQRHFIVTRSFVTSCHWYTKPLLGTIFSLVQPVRYIFLNVLFIYCSLCFFIFCINVYLLQTQLSQLV